MKTTICKNCDTTQYDIVPPTDHNWGEWKVTKSATAVTDGEETRVCRNDASHTETRVIPKLAWRSNTQSVRGKTAKVKYSKLKKKARALDLSKVMNLSDKGQGELTYSKISVGSKKVNKKYGRKIVINSKTGRVTVKKGLKKGSYKVKAQVTAAGDDCYEPAARVVTFKIKVK